MDTPLTTQLSSRALIWLLLYWKGLAEEGAVISQLCSYRIEPKNISGW